MKIDAKQIRDITESMDMGLVGHIHKETGKVIFIPDERSYFYDEPEGWEEETEILEKYPEDYFEIEKWSSSEQYDVMVNFTDEIVPNSIFKSKLYEALNRKRPFANFKHLVESSEFRKQWFAYKLQWEINYVKKELTALGFEAE